MIVFLWQIPHFYAIGWLHREDYAGAGLPVISVIDPDGRKTSRLAILFIVALIVLTLFPFFMDLAGRAYLAGAILLGLMFLGYAIISHDCAMQTPPGSFSPPPLFTSRPFLSFWRSISPPPADLNNSLPKLFNGFDDKPIS